MKGNGNPTRTACNQFLFWADGRVNVVLITSSIYSLLKLKFIYFPHKYCTYIYSLTADQLRFHAYALKVVFSVVVPYIF